MFGEILQKFAEKSPVTVMVQGLLECLLDSEKIDRWFDSTCQTPYTKEILFSSLVFLMLNVVCRIRSSVHCVYRKGGVHLSAVTSTGCGQNSAFLLMASQYLVPTALRWTPPL